MSMGIGLFSERATFDIKSCIIKPNNWSGTFAMGNFSSSTSPSSAPITTVSTSLEWFCQDGDPTTFPEQARNIVNPCEELTGICFSGGGTRALCAAAGQLRALRALNILDRIHYVSGVSGGSWAAALYAYSHVQNDDVLLGPHTDPEDITPQELVNSRVDPLCMMYGSTLLFAEQLLAEAERGTPSDEIWIRAVGETFLKPLGLYDRDEVAYFSYRQDDVDSILKRNPVLSNAVFRTVREDIRTPFPIFSSTILGPRCYAPFTMLDPAPFEYTPLYVGMPMSVTMTVTHLAFPRSQKHPLTLGGCLIEPFAMDSPTPFTPGFASQDVQLSAQPFDLFKAVGSSSAAMGGITDDFPILLLLGPHANYVTSVTVPAEDTEYTMEPAALDVGVGSEDWVLVKKAPSVPPTPEIFSMPSTPARTTRTSRADSPCPSVVSSASGIAGALAMASMPFHGARSTGSGSHTGTASATGSVVNVGIGVASSSSGGAVASTVAAAVGTAVAAATAAAAAAAADETPRSPPPSPVFDVPFGQSLGQTPAEALLEFSDGGCIENYGLISLLRRRVKKIMVFINTSEPLSVIPYSPADPWSKQQIDKFLPPLFGFPDPMRVDGVVVDYNQVFKQEAFMPIVNELQRQVLLGNTAAASATLDVLENTRWGIAGGWQTQVCFVYLTPITRWNKLLSADASPLVFSSPCGSPRFPNYKTIGENSRLTKPTILELTSSQALLLADFSHWALTKGCEDVDMVTKFFGFH